ncbi:MAG: AAA family ATPase [Propionibacteriaceae bacterium]
MGRIKTSIGKVIEGKPDAIDMVLTVLLAEGHLLLEDVPGVGKTVLAKSLAASTSATVHRIQFTPDMLPSDITGVSIYNQATGAFEFKPGGIFANIVIGDEINRASPKTQAALLESMEECQVSADGVTYPLARPFMVIATQNPIEMEGTYPLPEAQRDRFMAKISMGYPAREAEIAMLDNHTATNPLDHITPVATADDVMRCIETVRHVFVSDAIKNYVLAIVEGTRTSPLLRLGASPRASISLLRAAKAQAALQGRDYVNPEDIRSLTTRLLSHRIVLSAQAHMDHKTTQSVVDGIIALVPVPGER